MKEHEAKRYCANYLQLTRRRVIVEALNNKVGYQKLDPPIDNENCGHCNNFPSLMPMKVCFELRWGPKILRWFWIFRHCHQLYRLQSPIIRR